MSLQTEDETGSGSIWWYPADLAFVSVAAIVGYVLVTSLGSGSVTRLVVTLPVLFFLPGYALTALLFPAAERQARQDGTVDGRSRPGGIDTVERLGLSIALSLAIVPVLAILLAPTSWGLNPTPAAAAIGILTIVAAQLGVVRRLRLPERDRYTISVKRGFRKLRGSRNPTTTARASAIVLIVAILLAGGVLALAVASPLSAAEYTELGLYAEDEDGHYVDADLPSAVEPGESIPVVVGVENQEGQEKTYTVVVQEQRLEDDQIVDRTELRRIDYRVSNGGTAYGEREITPEADEDTVRIAFLLYETADGDDGNVPDVPSSSNADEEVYFWTDVTESADGSTDDGGDAAPGDDAPDGGDDSGEAGDGGDDDGFPFDFGGIFEDE